MFDTSFIQKPVVESIDPSWAVDGITIDVLRLDKIHPIISGNKWYKLKLYLAKAIAEKKQIVTFGGGWSNHILATAFVCNVLGIPCKGIIRGRYDLESTAMLTDAALYGMELIFLDKTGFTDAKQNLKEDAALIIPEGGLGMLGVDGMTTLKDDLPKLSQYSHIICAAGTGTMAAGLLSITTADQKLLAINVTKNNPETKQTIQHYTAPTLHSRLEMLDNYHFGGYAKKSDLLLHFMNDTWQELSIPLDFVYTARSFYALKNEIQLAHFPKGSKILFIHSGGLQGNRSIPNQALLYNHLNA